MIKIILETDDKDIKYIYDALLPDFKNRGRAKVHMKLDKNILRFESVSDDYTSQRAVINGILLKLRMLNEIKNI